MNTLKTSQSKPQAQDADNASEGPDSKQQPSTPKKEIGGRGGLEPTRYGDWEKGGKCVDF